MTDEHETNAGEIDPARINEQTISELRDLGCAVVVFIPQELQGVSPTKTEDAMIATGWETIAYLQE